MRKPTEMDDSRNDDKSEGKRPATRRREPRSQAVSPSPGSVACSSITLPINSQEKEKAGGIDINEHHLSGVVGIDWFQLAACVVWDGVKSKHWFEQLLLAKTCARQLRRPALLKIGADLVSVSAGGQGRGNDSYKEIQLEWKEIQVGLSERNNATRKLSNASLTVSGKPCLITGWADAWVFFRNFVESIGGVITDEWLRRLDICIDLPELNFRETVYPLLKNHQFNTRCRDRKYNEDGDRPTGFSAGKSNRLRVLIYDKARECLKQQDALYAAAMIQRRWGGVTPSCATRIEWQIGRSWLKQFGLDRSESLIDRMADVFGKLTNDVGGAFRITATTPDRSNNHQSRTASHPIWTRIVDIGKETLGQALQPLVRLDRSNLDEQRAINQIVGFTTSIADRRGEMCVSKANMLRILSETMDRQKVGDVEISESFERKAKKSGTWQDLMSFPEEDAA